MKYGHRIALVVAFGIAAFNVFAQDAGPARTALEGFASGLDSFQADFNQIVKSQDGRVQDRTSGKVWLQTPDKLRWVYLGDFPETIVADGTNIWIHDESLQQVTVKPQSDQATDSPLMILADISQLDSQFHVNELGDYENMMLLELRSQQSESEFERILLGLDGNGIRLMVMEDAFGQRTEINFENILKNRPVDSLLFSFSAPEGTDVVGVPTQPE
jgi:outer membrane lipoprotein carrier protein